MSKFLGKNWYGSGKMRPGKYSKRNWTCYLDSIVDNITIWKSVQDNLFVVSTEYPESSEQMRYNNRSML